MNCDIRLSTTFREHRKRKKLQRRLGPAGVVALIDFLLMVSQTRPDGVLDGLTPEDIELDANWDGEPGLFYQTLTDPEVRFLDTEPVLRVHDWKDWNGYASSASTRADKARMSNLRRWHPKIAEKLEADGVDRLTSDEYAKIVDGSVTDSVPIRNGSVTESSSSSSISSSISNSISSSSQGEGPAGPAASVKKQMVDALVIDRSRGEVTVGSTNPEAVQEELAKLKRFSAPSVEEVKAYVNERVAQGKPYINAEEFVSHYETNGWMRGKNKIKDWKACVRTWEQKIVNEGRQNGRERTYEGTDPNW